MNVNHAGMDLLFGSPQTYRNFLFVRPIVLSATRMGENWFWVSPGTVRLYPRQELASSGNFWLFSQGQARLRRIGAGRQRPGASR